MNNVWLIVVGLGLTAGGEHRDSVYRPPPVERCLRSPKAAGLSLMIDSNPYYLRGDLDGDGRPDYVLRMRSTRGQTGLLVCSGNGSVILLGAGIGGLRLSDMPNDRFVAQNWALFEKSEVASLAFFRSNVPRPVPDVVGESIGIIWEDGIALIYWDGARFRWVRGET